MFRGETAVELSTRLGEAEFHRKVEDALAGLGRVRVDRRGSLSVARPSPLGSFLTEVELDGTVRPLGDGLFDVAVRYDCRPTAACWALAVGLFLVSFFGAAVILVPLLDKKQVAARVRAGLARLEPVADDRPG